MINIQCNVNSKKVHFAKQIASRLHGKIEHESPLGELNISFSDNNKAYQFNRFVFVINQSFA